MFPNTIIPGIIEYGELFHLAKGFAAGGVLLVCEILMTCTALAGSRRSPFA